MSKYNKDGSKNRPWHTKKAQDAFNAWIRHRDRGNGCCSCDSSTFKDAGHYISVGASSLHRFNEKNVHGQCGRCNNWMSGNHVPYRKFMIKEYGEDYVLEIEQNHGQPKKRSIEELEGIRKKYEDMLNE